MDETKKGKKRKHGGGGWKRFHHATKKGKTEVAFQEGMKGLLVTCNHREVDTVRETYNLIQEYVDRMEPDTAPKTVDDEDDDDDIEAAIKNEVKELSTPREKKYRQVMTRCKNIIFVKVLDPVDPLDLTEKLFANIREGYGKRSRYINRLTPILTTCKATREEVEEAVSKLLDNWKDDTNSRTTYMVNVKIRNNNDLKTFPFVEAASVMVKKKKPSWKVNFDSPDITINIDILISVACISFLKDYYELKKYNVIEFASYVKKEKEESKNEKDGSKNENVEEQPDTTTTEDT